MGTWEAGQQAVCDDTLMRVLAKGFFWQELLDSGRVSSIAEIAKHEGMEKVRVQKMLRLAPAGARCGRGYRQGATGGRGIAGVLHAQPDA